MKPTARCFTHDWTAEWLISEAKAALEANHQEVAARLLHEAVSLEPGNVEAQLLLGWTAATPAAAVEYFQTTLALAPDDSLAEDGLAWATEWLVQEHTQLMTPALGPHWQTPLTPSEVHWTPSPSLTGKGEAERTVPPRLRGSEADKFGVAGSALTPQPPLLPVRRAGEGVGGRGPSLPRQICPPLNPQGEGGPSSPPPPSL